MVSARLEDKDSAGYSSGIERPVRVLMVDDEPKVARPISTFLSLRGFDVDVVHDLASAFARLPEHDHFDPYDVALLDYGLPDGDVETLLTAVACMPWPPQVVMLTGYPHRAAELAQRYPIREILPKPANSGELLEALSRAAAATANQWERIRTLDPPTSPNQIEHCDSSDATLDPGRETTMYQALGCDGTQFVALLRGVIRNCEWLRDSEKRTLLAAAQDIRADGVANELGLERRGSLDTRLWRIRRRGLDPRAPGALMRLVAGEIDRATADAGADRQDDPAACLRSCFPEGGTAFLAAGRSQLRGHAPVPGNASVLRELLAQLLDSPTRADAAARLGVELETVYARASRLNTVHDLRTPGALIYWTADAMDVEHAAADKRGVLVGEP